MGGGGDCKSDVKQEEKYPGDGFYHPHTPSLAHPIPPAPTHPPTHLALVHVCVRCPQHALRLADHLGGVKGLHCKGCVPQLAAVVALTGGKRKGGRRRGKGEERGKRMRRRGA